MNLSQNVGDACSGTCLTRSFHRLRLWGTAFLCVLLVAGLVNAAEEPKLLKEIAWAKGHANAQPRGPLVSVTVATFSPDGKKAATATYGMRGFKAANVKVWEIPTLKKLYTCEVEEDTWINGLAWSPDGRYLAVCANKSATGPDGKTRSLEHFGEVRLLDQDGKLRRTILHTGPVFKVLFRKDGSALSAGLGPPLLWSVKDEKEPISIPEMTLAPLDPTWDFTRRMRGRRGSPWIWNDAALSPDGRRLLASAGERGEDRTVLWDLETRKELAQQTWYALKAAYSPDGRRIAMIVLPIDQPRDYWVELWESKFDTKVWRSSKGYIDLGKEIFFSADGELIVSPDARKSGRDFVRVVRLWKTSTGREAGEFELDAKRGHGRNISGLAISPDGKLLLAGTREGHIVLCQFPFPPANDKPAEKER